MTDTPALAARIRKALQGIQGASMWDNRSAPGGATNTIRGLTHPLDQTERPAPMKATQCSVDGCDKPQKARGICGTHYERWRQNGTTALVGHRLPPAAFRLAGGLVEQPNGCLEWTGHTSLKTGYGQISIDNKLTYTHRLAWELANGPIPDGMLIRHYVCDNPPCCEPTHLRLGTQSDNVADMLGKGRDRNGQETKTHCPQGHLYDEVNTYVTPSGRGRGCKTCRKAAKARYLAKKAS